MEKSIYNNFYHYLIGHYEEVYRQGQGDCDSRRKAFEFFKQHGFPSTKNEDWKYSNLNRFLKTEYLVSDESPSDDLVPKSLLFDIEAVDAYRIVLLNGRYLKELSDEMPAGVEFGYGSVEENPGFTVPELGTGDAMLALNTAFRQHSYLLKVRERTVVDKPVYIFHTFSCPAAYFLPYRLNLVAEPRSEISFIESFYSVLPDSNAFINYVSLEYLQEEALVTSCLVNNLRGDLNMFHHREIFQKEKSVYNNTAISFPAASFIRNNINVRLKGSYTDTNLLGLYLSGNSQLVDNHTVVDHQMPNCNSYELYKGILLDKSHGVFNGKVFVRPDAQKTNAFQQNNNLLLSDRATINTKPQLEIFADDVKCSHGSTVGKIDKEALFYLRSRGISEQTANKLMIEAFAYDVLSKIRIPAFVDYTRKLLYQYLESKELAVVEPDLEAKTTS